MAMEMTALPWLEKLLSITTFFSVCGIHTNVAKNECNMFCLDCNDNDNDQALCGSCVNSGHEDHRVIQIRRSSYNEVVKAKDIEMHVDILGIQPYVINSSKVVFLNKRFYDPPKRKNYKSSCYCRVCLRNLVDCSYFCSLACKLAWIKAKGSFVVSAKKEEEMRRKMQETTKRSAPKEKKEKLPEGTPKRKRQEEEKAEEKGTTSPNRPSASKRSSTSRRKGIPHRAPFF